MSPGSNILWTDFPMTLVLTCSFFIGQLTEPLAPSAPPPATTAAASTTAPVTVSSGRHVTRTPANVPVDNTISGDTCLATGKGLLYTA